MGCQLTGAVVVLAAWHSLPVHAPLDQKGSWLLRPACSFYPQGKRHPETMHTQSQHSACHGWCSAVLSQPQCGPRPTRCSLSCPLLLQVSPVMSALCLEPAAALTLLQAEAAGHDLQAGLLAQPALDSLSQQWRALSEVLEVPLTDLMAALAEQVSQPGAR